MTNQMLLKIERMSFWGKYSHSSPSIGWAFTRSNINNLWSFVVVIRHFIISPVLVIQCDINYGRWNVIECWWNLTRHPVGINRFCLYVLVRKALIFGVVKVEATECIICVVNCERVIFNQHPSKLIWIVFLPELIIW